LKTHGLLDYLSIPRVKYLMPFPLKAFPGKPNYWGFTTLFPQKFWEASIPIHGMAKKLKTP